MVLRIDIRGPGIDQMQRLVDRLGSETRARRAYAMALNKTAAKVRTQVKRSVATQMGLRVQKPISKGLKISKASSARQVAIIKADGITLGTRHFGARAKKNGVSANPWGVRRVFPRTFIIPSLGNQVFHRTGAFSRASNRNNAIKKHYGPAMPKELVVNESAKTFHAITDKEMPKEMAAAIRALTGGFVK